MANTQITASLLQSIQNVATIINTQTALWVAAGCPPTFSVDGESYQWNEWLKARNEELQGLIASRQQVSGSWIVRSTGRA